MALILVADDNDDLCALIELALQRDGHVVTTASDGAAALTACLTNDHDLAVLDIMMPLMSGLEVTERVRADPSVSMRILLLTALGASDDRQRGYDVGADDYMTKPFGLVDLVERVRGLVGDELSIA
ncbi:response regulator [Nocardioides sp.]|uniref:response regulator transcription factor n=1 Tax=Nocardioides sp. TaxID=35761 RepID=UPI00286B261F|nr:response regulator [Nocardioides sp.]